MMVTMMMLLLLLMLLLVRAITCNRREQPSSVISDIWLNAKLLKLKRV